MKVINEIGVQNYMTTMDFGDIRTLIAFNKQYKVDIRPPAHQAAGMMCY